jgi:acyl phosphate:glycerol-3-phosphate acyltransferase
VLVAGVVFVTVVGLSKYVSLGSIAGALTIPVYSWIAVNPTPVLAAAVVGALLIVLAHRGNIARILRGTEPRISDLKR